MLSTYNATVLHTGCTQYDIPVPKAVLAAEALHAAAVVLLAGIRAEIAPDLETITLKNMTEVHAQMVATTTRPARERAAVEIEGLLEHKRTHSWHIAAADLCEAFRVPFDTAAATFTTALAALDGNTDAETAINAGLHEQHHALTTSAADLQVLTGVRDALGTALPIDVGSSGGGMGLDRLGRICVLPDWDTIALKIPVRTGGLTPFTPAWFAALISIPGVSLKWRTPAEQQTVAQLAAHHNAA